MNAKIIPLRVPERPPLWAPVAGVIVGSLLFVMILSTMVLAAAAQAIAERLDPMK